jgi:hypothetical protein
MSERDQKPDPPSTARASGDVDHDVDPDAPPTAEEIAESRRLRDALEGAGGQVTTPDMELVNSLRAAWSPDPLDEGVHASILDDLPTAEEIALAAELRDALDAAPSPGSSHTEGNATFALSLRAAWKPGSLDEAAHRAIVDRALGLSARRAGAREREREREREPGEVVPLDAAKRMRQGRMRVVLVTTTSVLALAASVVVWITTGPSARGIEIGHGQEAPLARVRSTQPLFDEPFRSGETSARIDRIALARAADYRDNRFAKWGVR